MKGGYQGHSPGLLTAAMLAETARLLLMRLRLRYWPVSRAVFRSRKLYEHLNDRAWRLAVMAASPISQEGKCELALKGH